MGTSVNKVILVGRLGKDPEVRFTASGTAVANFSIATDESYKDKQGEKRKKTEWHNIVVWGNSVEAFVQKYLHKGDMVYVEGKLQTRSWDDKDGNKKYTTEINVTDIKGLVLQNADDNPRPAQPQRPQQHPTNKHGNPQGPARPAQRPAPQQFEAADDDIGF